MELEDAAGARFGVEAAAETGFLAGDLVEKRERAEVRGEGVGEAVAVLGRLELDAGERRAGFLGLDYACGPAVDKEYVIGKSMPGGERELSDRDPARGPEVRVGNAEHGPAGFGEGSIDKLTGGCLGRGHGRSGSASPGSEVRLQVNWLIVTRVCGSGK